MLEALFFGLAASNALVMGRVAGAYTRPPQRLVAALAFAGGAVLASLADILMPDAFATDAGFFLSFMVEQV